MAELSRDVSMMEGGRVEFKGGFFTIPESTKAKTCDITFAPA